MTDINATTPAYLEEDAEKEVRFDIGLLDGLLRPAVESEIRDAMIGAGADLEIKVLSDPDDEKSDMVPKWFTDRRYRQYFYTVWCRYGLRGWQGLKDARGHDVEFHDVEVVVPLVGKRRVVDPELLRGLRAEWIEELGAKVFGLNIFTPERERSF